MQEKYCQPWHWALEFCLNSPCCSWSKFWLFLLGFVKLLAPINDMTAQIVPKYLCDTFLMSGKKRIAQRLIDIWSTDASCSSMISSRRR